MITRTQRLAAAPVLFAIAACAEAGVQGQCVYKGKTLRFVDGHFARAPDPFDDKALLPTFWFATVAFDHAPLNAAAPDKIDEAVTRQVFDKDSAELQLRLDAEGKAVEQLHLYVPPGSNQSYSSNEVGTLSLSAPVGKRAAGRFQIKEDEWSCDLQFDLGAGAAAAPAAKGAAAKPAAAAVPAKPAGQALPAGGGEPGKAYLALHKATLASDVDGMLGNVRASRAAEMRASQKTPEFPQMLAMVRAFEPAQVRIVSGLVNGDEAILQIAGKDSDGAAMTGEVRLVLEKGAWKVDEVSTRSGAGN
jgi:hypothetical protein